MSRKLRCPLNVHIDVEVMEILMQRAADRCMSLPDLVRKALADAAASPVDAAIEEYADDTDEDYR